MLDEQLEFSISQYLDGTLPADETAALEARLKDDAAARELLEEYRKLNTLLTSPATLPAIAWDDLAAQLSGAVREAEQAEFAISQYADGVLPADEVEAIEARLADDAGARDLLDEHRKVSALLKAPDSLPAIQWERLATHLSDFVADATEPPTIKLFARPWVRGFAGLAMAACVLLASALGIHAYLAQHNAGTPIADLGKGMSNRDIARPTAIVQITGPQIEHSEGSALAEITIGAGPDSSAGSPAFAEGIVSRPARSLIATGAPSAQDYSQTPF